MPDINKFISGFKRFQSDWLGAEGNPPVRW